MRRVVVGATLADIILRGLLVLGFISCTGLVLETSAQGSVGGCPPVCGTCYVNLTCSSCQDYSTLYQGTCEPCGTNCVQCTHGANCTLCEAGNGPIFNTLNCGSCSQSVGCSGICNNNGAGKCDVCKPGYRLENGDCRPCISNCRSCLTNVSYCDACFPGYGTFPGNKTCGPCSSHCSIQNTCYSYGAHTCDKCDNGFYWTPDKACGPCSSNCAAGCNMTGASKCDRCDLGYGLLPNGSCGKCREHCLSCPATTSECETCEFGFAVFDPGNKSCEACSKYCTMHGCFNKGPGACDQCDTGFFYYKNTSICGLCAANCYSCAVKGADQCDYCTFGYGLTHNNTCEHCSANCSSCASIGAGYCDNCTVGYRLLPNNTCARTSVSTTTTNSGISPSTASIRTSITSFRTSTTTTLTTAVAGLSSTGIHVASNVTPCPILEVGLGIGIPCGFIIIVLLIIVICMCVQNKSLREYKRQNQDNEQNHSKDSSASNGTNQLPMTAYQHLDARNSKRQYDVIDRYDTISTITTENTGHYETPLN